MLKALLAAALLSGQAATVPGSTRCITRGEIGDLTLVGASVAVEVVRNACRTFLPTTAFLATPAGAEFSARLRVEGQRRLNSAIDGIARASGGGANMPRAVIRTFVRGLLTEGAGADFAQHADASLCRDANEIMEIASTLTPDQMARFVGAFASIGDHLARMRPPRPTPSPELPVLVPTPLPSTSEAPPPSPHPAVFETAPRQAPAPVVIVPVTPAPGIRAARRPPRPPFAPFLCQHAQ